ncbi:MAG: hypothetical protein FJZ86_18345 [Chloroflexi bacterium]|nr:hypothetical protein [Chloroflexota bacterium]
MQLLQMALRPRDIVYTPDTIAKFLVDFFRPSGRILEPCKGDGAFLKYLPNAEWCEIAEGKDFFQWHEKVDWCFGNPPYGLFSEWLDHTFTISENAMYLIPLYKVYYDFGRLKKIHQYGGIKSICVLGRGEVAAFPFGQAVAGVHFQKGYRGATQTTIAETRLTKRAADGGNAAPEFANFE